MRHPIHSMLILVSMLGILPAVSYAVDAQTYDSVHQNRPLIKTDSDTDLHERVVNSTANAETTDPHSGIPATTTSLSTAHKKQVPATNAPNNVSAVDLDSDRATSTAPLGGTSKAPIGEGVIARMPGAQGR